MEKFKYLNKNEISHLPKNPGVYVFFAYGGSASGRKRGRKFLYIGKASNIRERVKNHFSKSVYRDNLFIDQVKRIGYIETNSEFVALILEANLIKKYQPKYNVIWKDDKNYFYVGITKEDYPRVFITHQPKNKLVIGRHPPAALWKLEIKYIGPFVDGKALKQTLKILRRVFPYRTCNPPAGGLPKRPCLWYQLGRCPAPCLLKTKLAEQLPNAKIKMKGECQRNIRNLTKILQGKKNQVLKNLKKEMKKSSDLQNFEKAAKIRDRIEVLKKVLAHAKIFESQLSTEVNWLEVKKTLQKILKTKNKISRIEAYDISNIQGKMATGSMIVFTNGKPEKSQYRKFRIKLTDRPNDIAMIKEVLTRRFKHPEWRYPDLILVDGGKAQLNAVLSCLKWKFKQIKVMALAKRKNELYLECRRKPIRLNSFPDSLKFMIIRLRDEAHRFAISYHKKLRVKSLLKG